tara:strand:+ start:371 stop:1567 length:1197 start_codon:yes stop_codon:yes gene_type:complete
MCSITSFNEFKETVGDIQSLLDGPVVDAMKAEKPIEEDVYVRMSNLNKKAIDQATQICTALLNRGTSGNNDNGNSADTPLYREVLNGDRTIASIVEWLSSLIEDRQQSALVSMIYLTGRCTGDVGAAERCTFQEALVREGVVAPLLAVVTNSPEEHTLALPVTVLLEQLCYHNRFCQQRMMDQGVVEAMVAQLNSRHGNSRLQEYSADVLRTMMRNNSPCQQHVQANLGIEALAPLLDSSNPRSTRLSGLRALVELSPHPDSQLKMYAVGIIPHLVELLSLDYHKTQESAVIVLSRIITSGPSRSKELVDAGGIPAFLLLLESENTSLKQLILRLLDLLLDHGLVPREMIATQDGIRILAKCIRNGNDLQAELAERILNALASIPEHPPAKKQKRASS